MLQAVLDEAEARAQRVVQIASATGRVEPRDHAQVVVTQVVPIGRQRRTEVLSFVDQASARIEGVLRQNDLESGRAELARITEELLTLSARTGELGAAAGAARAAIQLDLAKVGKEIADLRVQVSVRATQAAEAEAKARDRANRSNWTWLAGPLGKAIDELVGVLQDGTSTEESARRAIEELTRCRQELQQMDDTTHSLTLLSEGADQLTRGVQSLVNNVALILGHAQNARDDLTDVSHLELFCRTAILDLDNLRQNAA